MARIPKPTTTALGGGTQFSRLVSVPLRGGPPAAAGGFLVLRHGTQLPGLAYLAFLCGLSAPLRRLSCCGCFFWKCGDEKIPAPGHPCPGRPSVKSAMPRPSGMLARVAQVPPEALSSLPAKAGFRRFAGRAGPRPLQPAWPCCPWASSSPGPACRRSAIPAAEQPARPRSGSCP